MFEWLGPIIAHWPGLFLPLAFDRADTELHAFCALRLSWIGMSFAGYARWENDSSAACSAAGPASTAAVFCLELASGSAAFFSGTAERVPCEPFEPTASSNAVAARPSTATRPSAIRALFISIDLLPFGRPPAAGTCARAYGLRRVKASYIEPPRPAFPQKRKGRARRPLRLSCRQVLRPADRARAGPRPPVRKVVTGREDVLVVDDAVRGRERVRVAGVGPDRVGLHAPRDGQPAVVAVEPGLGPVRRVEDGREDVEVVRRAVADASGEDVVRLRRLYTRHARCEPAGRRGVFVGNTLAAVVAHADAVAGLRALVDRRHVVVEPGVRVDRADLRPVQAAVVRDRLLDVELAVAVVLPDRLEVVVLRVVLGDPREVVRADPRPWYALLRAASEVAERLTGDDVVPDLHRRRAVQVCGPGGRAAGRPAMHAELLAVRVAGRGVAVVEDHFQAAVRQRDGIRALVEVALVRVEARREDVAEEAQRRAHAADLLRRRPGQPVVGRHRAVDRRLRERSGRLVELEDRPGHVDVVAVRTRRVPVGRDHVLVVDDEEAVVLDGKELLRGRAGDRARHVEVVRAVRPAR